MVDDIREFFEKRLNIHPRKEDLFGLKELLKQFSEAVESLLGLKVRIIPKAEIVDWWQKRKGTIPEPTLSLDWSLTADYRLDFSRVVDPNTLETVGISSRRGFPPLEKQLSNIDPGSYAIVDDGSTRGSLVKRVNELLERRGASIGSVWLGVAHRKAIDVIKGLGLSVEAFYVNGFVDWANARDIVGLDGKLTTKGTVVPYWKAPHWIALPDEFSGLLKELWERGYRIVKGYGITVPWEL